MQYFVVSLMLPREVGNNVYL